MKLLITGSRNFQNYTELNEAIDALTICLQLADEWDCTPTEILHGGAKGADQLAAHYAEKHKLPQTILRPNYEKHGGKAAPLLRNTELVKLADCTVALYETGRNRKGGTADTAAKTKKARKPLLEWHNDTVTYTPPQAAQTTLW